MTSDGPEFQLSIPTDTSNLVPNTRRINTTAPLAGGGDLTADRTLSIDSSVLVPQLLTTAGQGYFLGGGFDIGDTLTGGTTIAANTVRAVQFVLPFKITIRTVSARASAAGGAGTLFAVGIYDVNGNKLIDSGTFNGNNIATRQSNAIAAVTLNPGVYFYAWTATSAAIAVAAFIVNMNPNTEVTGFGVGPFIANNGSAAGVLPATLGGISGYVATNVWIALFQP